MNINKELDYIHAVLGTKHYFFAETSDHGVMLRLEDDVKCKYSFKGMTMITAITAAKDYIKQEINAGSLQEVDMTDEDPSEKSIQEKEKTDTPNILSKFKRKK